MMLRWILAALLLCYSCNARSQAITGRGLFSPIPHEEEWVSGALTLMNAGFAVLNVIHFDNDERRSNAGFMIIPGLFQAGYGITLGNKKSPKVMQYPAWK